MRVSLKQSSHEARADEGGVYSAVPVAVLLVPEGPPPPGREPGIGFGSQEVSQMSAELTRRGFLKATGGAAVAAGIGLSSGASARAGYLPGGGGGAPGPQRTKVSANEKVVLGFVGVAGRGFGEHMHTFGAMPDVELGAVCDVYQPHLDRAVSFTQGKAKGYHDFRRLVENPDLDAVVVATPP